MSGWSEVSGEGGKPKETQGRERSRSRSRSAVSTDSDTHARKAQHTRNLLSGHTIDKPHTGFANIEWWREPLWTSLQHKRQDLPLNQPRPVLVESFCTGSFSEGVAMGSLGIDYKCVLACDKKGASAQFVMSNFPKVSHFFTSLADQISASGECKVHSGMCELSDEDMASSDILIGGFPCQPFTHLRQRNGSTPKTGAVSGHPDANIALEEIPALLRKRKPKVAIFEQVKAFGENSNGVVWMDEFVENILSQHFAAVRVIMLNLSDWVTATRERRAAAEHV